MITIVTAIKNGEKDIGNLITSLNNQNSSNFKWLVVDSMSTDNSLNIIEATAKFPFKIYSQPDFSIYHALNIAIEKIDTDYYCVAGCDDAFAVDFVEQFSKWEEFNYDLILGSVISNGKVFQPFVSKKWLSPVNASHSVGTIIRTDVHKKVGLYSRMYPILADKKLVMDVEKISNKIFYTDKIFGEYSQEGFSSLNSVDYLCDLFKLQLAFKNKSYLQAPLFFLRISKLFALRRTKG